MTKPVEGVGLGLRYDLADELLERRPDEVRWLEIHPENYVARGGRFEHNLERARETWPIITHGLTCGVGTASAFEPAYTSQLRDLLEAGAPLALGSDFPVEDPNPLEGLYAAVTRKTRDGNPADGFPSRDQKLTIGEALAAFTSGAAYAAHQETRRGRLEPGYFADLTVLDDDLLGVATLECPIG